MVSVFIFRICFRHVAACLTRASWGSSRERTASCNTREGCTGVLPCVVDYFTDAPCWRFRANPVSKYTRDLSPWQVCARQSIARQVVIESTRKLTTSNGGTISWGRRPQSYCYGMLVLLVLPVLTPVLLSFGAVAGMGANLIPISNIAD